LPVAIYIKKVLPDDDGKDGVDPAKHNEVVVQHEVSPQALLRRGMHCVRYLPRQLCPLTRRARQKHILTPPA